MTNGRASAGSPLAAIAVALGLLAALAASGCRAKGKDFENENDALRKRVLELETSLADTQARETEMRAKYEEMKLAAAGLAEQQALDALPRCAGVLIDRFSGPVDTDDDGALDAVDIYVRPYDGRRRFVQVVGTLTVEVSLLGVTGASETPRLLGSAELSAADLREAYRSSPLGTHYTVRLPLDTPIAAPGTLVLRASLLDRVSGLQHADQRLVELSAGAR